ncbi:MAG: TrkH family potassium uptake protein [Anaerococcus vaginalis]|uniref:TrkH family potassium uptake protein n=1 Tax=Anaerococcus TaxID=165779 RepID=UPI0008A5772E|nr:MULTISPECIES: TrkH family potassium uptake protein [Anaerococcus]MDU5085813.1 TrkH family potassium uptake protein [Anaerococcus vaginalis]OFL17564.1 ATP synthase subunit J [Anaerococcus sp. HMSC068A02]
MRNISKNKQNFLEKLSDKITSNPPLYLTLGFAILIIIGGCILSLPIFTRSGKATNLVDSIFVASSASCVTGLTTVNTAEHWNTYGHILILILIQIGGLGVMTLATLFPLLLRKKIGLKSRQILKEQLNIDTLQGIMKLFKYVLVFTFLVEFLGAFLLSLRFVPIFGMAKGLWYSIFHSVSAFCNAGFDLLGDSIYPYRNDNLINITLMSLVVIGGLGFMVTAEIFRKKSFEKLSTHAKLVLIISASLIVIGTLAFYLIESQAGGVLYKEGFKNSIMQSAFQSVSARTAGFYSVKLNQMHDTSVLLLIILMVIGGSPGSTAGGLKTTTFGVLILSTISIFKQEDEVTIFKKHIEPKIIRKALAIIMVYLGLIFIVIFILSLSENFKVIDISYEVSSAFATVGASRGITGDLSTLGKILITISMYLGRIGPMTMAYSIGLKSKTKYIRFPEANISIG